MADYYNLKTGMSQTLNVNCRTGETCLVLRAFELHRSFVEAIFNYEKLQKQSG